jgi:hypothetical protein
MGIALALCAERVGNKKAVEDKRRSCLAGRSQGIRETDDRALPLRSADLKRLSSLPKVG